MRLFLHRYWRLLGRADSRQREHKRCKSIGFQRDSRSGRVSRAKYIAPMPPAPAAVWISYGPSFVPAAIVIS